MDEGRWKITVRLGAKTSETRPNVRGAFRVNRATRSRMHLAWRDEYSTTGL